MSSLIMFKIQKRIIENRSTEICEELIRKGIEYDLNGKLEFKSVLLFTDAYDNDPRALHDIPEMRKWCQDVFERDPSIFLVLDPSTINWFFPCVCEIKIISRDDTHTPFQFDEQSKKLTIDKIENSVRKRLEKIMADGHEVESELNRVIEYLRKIRT